MKKIILLILFYLAAVNISNAQEGWLNLKGTSNPLFKIGKNGGGIKWDDSTKTYMIITPLDTLRLATQQWAKDSLGNYIKISASWDSITNKPSFLGAVGTGLFLNNNYFGYFLSGTPKVYFDNTGKYYFTGDANNYISWNGTTQTVKGNIVITGGSGISNLSDANLDNIANGSTYAKVLTTSLSAGKILLSEATGTIDNISDGVTYSKVLKTSVSSGKIILSQTTGTIDDINDGTTYGKILATDIQSGHIKLVNAVGTLDDITNGTNYRKIASTDVDAGHITVVSPSASININSTTFGGKGIQLQYNTGVPRAYIGNGSTLYFNFDGTNLSWSGVNTSLTTGGLFTASNASITGAITASSGTIGSFTIGTYLYTGSKTSYNDNNSGIHIGSDGIGIGSNVFTVSSTGALTATNATISNGSSNSIFKADANGIYLGNSTFASAPFRVDMSGNVTATSITATGALTTGTGSAIDGQYINSLVANKITAGTGIINALSVLSTLTMGSASTTGTIQSYGWNGTANGFQIVGGASPSVNLIGGTITGGTIQTKADPGSGDRSRIVLNGANNHIEFYDYSNNLNYLYSESDFLKASKNLYAPSFVSTGQCSFANAKFYINADGTLTKINNIGAADAGVTGKVLMSDGYSFTPTALTSSHVTTALGFTPVTNARTITINGTGYDLSANRSWTVTASPDLAADYAWTGTHSWTKAVSGSYYFNVTNTEASNTSAISGMHFMSNQSGSSLGISIQAISSQYSDAAIAGWGRLITDSAMNGLILQAANGKAISLRINGVEYVGVNQNGLSITNGITIGTSSLTTAGTIKYSSGHFYGYNGTTWLQLDN